MIEFWQVGQGTNCGCSVLGDWSSFVELSSSTRSVGGGSLIVVSPISGSRSGGGGGSVGCSAGGVISAGCSEGISVTGSSIFTGVPTP